MKKNKSTILPHTLLHTYFIVSCLSIIAPLIWTFYSSFKTGQEFFMNPWRLPEQIQWGNYVTAWQEANIGAYFINTLYVSVMVTIVVAILSALTAYACTRLRLRIGPPTKLLFMAGLCVPTILCIIPIFLTVQKIHLIDNLFGLILVNIAQRLPFAVYVLSGFFVRIPHEYEEAACIDGCGCIPTFFRIILPVALPGVSTISVFTFLGVWNEYVIANTLLYSKQKLTLTIGLRTLLTGAQYQASYGPLFAALIIVMIPTMLVFIVFRKYIMTATTEGALKG